MHILLFIRIEHILLDISKGEIEQDVKCTSHDCVFEIFV